MSFLAIVSAATSLATTTTGTKTIENWAGAVYSQFTNHTFRASPRDATLSPLYTPHIRHAS